MAYVFGQEKPFLKGLKGYLETKRTSQGQFLGHKMHFSCINGSQKLRKFDKKVIVVVSLDDYYNEFGYKN